MGRPVRELRPGPRSALPPLAPAGGEGAGGPGAGDPRRYWRYHDALFEAQTRLADTTLLAIARELGLDLPGFAACLKSDRVASMVRRDADDAAKAGLSGTPSFVIGRTGEGTVKGQVVSGTLPVEAFRMLVREALRAKGGGGPAS